MDHPDVETEVGSLAYALAVSNRSMTLGSNCSAVAATTSCSCSTLVALAIAAVTLGRAISHATATVASVA
jgi:hypothetical protein